MPNRRKAMPGGRSNTPRPAKAWTLWHEHAACASQPSRLFYGHDAETSAERAAREAAAIAVCEQCPVRGPCQKHALSMPELYGVWGGTTEAHRKRSRRWSSAQPFDKSGFAS